MKDEIKSHRDSLLNENRSLRIQLEEARTRAQTEANEAATRAALFLEKVRTILQEKVNCDKYIDELETQLMQKEFSMKQLLLVKEEYLLKITALEKRLTDDSAYRDRLRAD